MIASKTWHCECCGEEIKPGEKITITKGTFLKEGHTMTAKDFLKSHVFICGIPKQETPVHVETPRKEEEPREEIRASEIPEQENLFTMLK